MSDLFAVKPQPSTLAPPITLTVALCTRNRTPQLRGALASIYDQTLVPAEILVVDNAPAGDATKELIAQHFDRVTYLLEAIEGLDNARNRALRESNSDIVVFLDDDAVADQNWLANIARVFSDDPTLAVVSGRVLPLSTATEAQKLFEANGGFSRGEARVELPEQPRNRPYGRYVPLIAWATTLAVGTNLGARRQVALACGCFDPALDLGATLPGGGDIDFVWRLVAAGHKFVYEPGALVWHEHRRGMDAVEMQIIGHQRALVAVLVKSLGTAEWRYKPSVLIYLIWRLLKPGVRLLRRAMTKDPLPGKLLLRMWWGCLTALSAYAAARQRADAPARKVRQE